LLNNLIIVRFCLFIRITSMLCALETKI